MKCVLLSRITIQNDIIHIKVIIIINARLTSNNLFKLLPFKPQKKVAKLSQNKFTEETYRRVEFLSFKEKRKVARYYF